MKRLLRSALHHANDLLTRQPLLTVAGAIILAALIVVAYLEYAHQRSQPSPEVAIRRLIYGVQ